MFYFVSYLPSIVYIDIIIDINLFFLEIIFPTKVFKTFSLHSCAPLL